MECLEKVPQTTAQTPAAPRLILRAPPLVPGNTSCGNVGRGRAVGMAQPIPPGCRRSCASSPACSGKSGKLRDQDVTPTRRATVGWGCRAPRAPHPRVRREATRQRKSADAWPPIARPTPPTPRGAEGPPNSARANEALGAAQESVALKVPAPLHKRLLRPSLVGELVRAEGPASNNIGLKRSHVCAASRSRWEHIAQLRTPEPRCFGSALAPGVGPALPWGAHFGRWGGFGASSPASGDRVGQMRHDLSSELGMRSAGFPVGLDLTWAVFGRLWDGFDRAGCGFDRIWGGSYTTGGGLHCAFSEGGFGESRGGFGWDTFERCWGGFDLIGRGCVWAWLYACSTAVAVRFGSAATQDRCAVKRNTSCVQLGGATRRQPSHFAGGNPLSCRRVDQPFVQDMFSPPSCGIV